MPFIAYHPANEKEFCRHPEHHPPASIVLRPGWHTWECPSCKEQTTIQVEPRFCDVGGEKGLSPTYPGGEPHLKFPFCDVGGEKGLPPASPGEPPLKLPEFKQFVNDLFKRSGPPPEDSLR